MPAYTIRITITTEAEHTYSVVADDEDEALDIADHRLLDLEDEGALGERQISIERAWEQVEDHA